MLLGSCYCRCMGDEKCDVFRTFSANFLELFEAWENTAAVFDEKSMPQRIRKTMFVLEAASWSVMGSLLKFERQLGDRRRKIFA